jgi:excisionase family DNA binding protein
MHSAKPAQPSFNVAAQSDHEFDVMTAKSVSRVLRVNKKTLYEMVRTRAIPGVIRMGRVLRFSRAALAKWLASARGE